MKAIIFEVILVMVLLNVVAGYYNASVYNPYSTTLPGVTSDNLNVRSPAGEINILSPAMDFGMIISVLSWATYGFPQLLAANGVDTGIFGIMFLTPLGVILSIFLLQAVAAKLGFPLHMIE